MTLILAAIGKKTIWMLADRRLSRPNRRPVDDARKIMFLETTDGVAILGYSGLGATSQGTEPADWMSAVLRGRNLPLEKSLGVLSEAMRGQIPTHLSKFPATANAAHTVIAPAFIDGKPSLYTIDLDLSPDRRKHSFRYRRVLFRHPLPAAPTTPRLIIGGSGVDFLVRDTRWSRSILRLIKANDRGAISARAVADQLAKLNHQTHQSVASVGPRAIVAWRFASGGGGQNFYLGANQESDSLVLPAVGRGTDWGAAFKIMAPVMFKYIHKFSKGEPTGDMGQSEINEKLKKLPTNPDEKLR